MAEKNYVAGCGEDTRKSGGIMLKLSPEFAVGIPDNMVLLPGGVLIFVEFKNPKKFKVGEPQKKWQRLLTKMGFRCLICFSRFQFREEALGWPSSASRPSGKGARFSLRSRRE